MSKKKTHKRKKKRGTLMPVLFALVITVAALIWLFGRDILNHIRAMLVQKQLQAIYVPNSGGEVTPTPEPIAQPITEPEPTVAPAPTVHPDFEGLYAINSHLIGWLKAGQTIDLPVMHYDNQFYLQHNFYGQKDDNGTLFMNEANRLSPRDSILMIHGHNMNSKAMFGRLSEYKDYRYLQNYPIITFRTVYDAEDVQYVPIAAFEASMRPGKLEYFDVTQVRFYYDLIPDDPNEKARSTHLESHILTMRELSFWDSPIEANSTDEYLMLLTCSYDHHDGRFVLLCRKLRQEETAESIQAMLQ